MSFLFCKPFPKLLLDREYLLHMSLKWPYYLLMYLFLLGLCNKNKPESGKSGFFCISSLIAGGIDATHPIKRDVNWLKWKE